MARPVLGGERDAAARWGQESKKDCHWPVRETMGLRRWGTTLLEVEGVSEGLS